MKKRQITIALATLCWTTYALSQTDDNVLRINFKGTDNPIETEHWLEGVHITFSNDGEQMNLNVNNATATYPLDHVSGMSHFNGTPQVNIPVYEDLGKPGHFYSTFYSGLEAYALPSDVKAYRATFNDRGDFILLTHIEGDVLPQGEAVLLYRETGGNVSMQVVPPSSVMKTDGNQLRGVDVQTAQTSGNKYFKFSYAQHGLGFYRMDDDEMLAANKAFISLPASTQVPSCIGLIFEEETAIDKINESTSQQAGEIYNLSGQRIGRMQRGVNIVNGKKVVIP